MSNLTSTERYNITRQNFMALNLDPTIVLEVVNSFSLYKYGRLMPCKKLVSLIDLKRALACEVEDLYPTDL